MASLQLHEDDALRAVRAAWDLRSALVDLNDRLEERSGVRIVIRTGVNTGLVVAGDSSAGQSFVTGDAVNVAARLEQAASPGEILIGDGTHRLVRDSVRVEPLGALPVQGRDLPVTAFRLLDVSPEGVGLSRRLDSPLVGRQRELAVLDDVLNRTDRERVCSLVSLIEFARYRQVPPDRGVPCWGRGPGSGGSRAVPPYGEGITFWPVTEVVRDAAGIGEDDSPDQALARIEAILADEPEAALVAQRVAGVIGLAGGGAAIQETIGRCASCWSCSLETDLSSSCSTTFTGGRRPSSISSSTLADPHTKSGSCSSAWPGLTLDARPSWGTGQPNATVRLEPLTEEESRQLINNLLAGAQVPRRSPRSHHPGGRRKPIVRRGDAPDARR